MSLIKFYKAYNTRITQNTEYLIIY